MQRSRQLNAKPLGRFLFSAVPLTNHRRSNRPMNQDETLATKPYRGLLYDELEEYEEVIAYLTAEIKQNPNNYIVYNNRGVAFAEIGRIDQALADFKTSIECSPTGT